MELTNGSTGITVTITDGSVVNLWVDHVAVGCGERMFVVVKMGTKFVHLFDPYRLKAIQVDRATFERGVRPSAQKPAHVCAFMRKKAREYRRFKLYYPKKALQAAEAALEEAP